MTRPRRCLVAAALGPVLVAGSLRADDSPALSIADLAAYDAALTARAEPGSVRAATFAELWEHPADHQGRPVAVAGRLARVFRQPAVGRFPPLAEGWITSPRGEPICVVFPTGAGPGHPVPATGSEVRFTGTFLRRITYRGADADRVAPLVVGPEPPVLDAAADEGGLGPLFGGDHAVDWLIGLVAAGGVGMMLLRRHLARPVVGPEPTGPAPAFRDADDPDDPMPDPWRETNEEADPHDDA